MFEPRYVIQVCLGPSLYMCVSVYVYVCVCMCVTVCVCLYMCMYEYVSACACVCVCRSGGVGLSLDFGCPHPHSWGMVQLPADRVSVLLPRRSFCTDSKFTWVVHRWPQGFLGRCAHLMAAKRPCFLLLLCVCVCVCVHTTAQMEYYDDQLLWC